MNQALNRTVAEKIMRWPAHNRRISPDYCGDANLTMQVVEKMGETHTVAVSANGDLWTAIIQRKDTPEYKDRGEAKRQQFGEAVCLAALRANGHSTEGL